MSASVSTADDNISNVLAYFASTSTITLKWSFPSYSSFDPTSITTLMPYGDLKSTASAAELAVGQTWSDPSVGQVESPVSPYVLLVGSGFMPKSVQAQANRGNTVAGSTFYMLNVENGSVLAYKDVGNDNKGESVDNCATAGDCSKMKNALQSDPDCSVSATSTSCVGTLPGDGASDEITGLLENDTAYTLTEDPGPEFTLTSITCVVGSTTYPGSAFKVQVGETTVCTITNTLLKTTPDQNTDQAGQAQIFDAINLSSIRAGASDAATATVTFRLYSDSACTNQVGTVGPVSLTYGAVDPNTNRTTATANTLTTPLTINQGVVYYWQVTYSGDAFNNGFTTSCGQETASVAFTFID
jgi:hypothetical protein